MDEEASISSSNLSHQNEIELVDSSEINNSCDVEVSGSVQDYLNNETSVENVSVEKPSASDEGARSAEDATQKEISSVVQEHQIERESAEHNTKEKSISEQSVSLMNQAPKRRLSVITISDTDSDDSSDVCLVDSYQASASEAKRIRRGYSTSDSDSVSSEEEILSDADNPTVVVHGAPSILSKCCSTLGQRAPRETIALLNPCFVEKSFVENLSEHWQKEKDYTSSNTTLFKNPFRVCVLDQFLDNSDFIHNIVDDMTTLDWSRRKMDLYEFHRSSDLVNLSWQRAIKSFYDLLKDQVMSWISEITKLKLTNISASCALYGPGDHLLVHDDLMSDRKVAFIFYISPWDINKSKVSDPELATKDSPDNVNEIESNAERCQVNCSDENETKDANQNKDNLETPQFQWKNSMGGALELLTTDDNGLPTVVTKSIFPNNNSFAFFKVDSNTFHQVSEVLTFDYPRLTINGWFHGPPEETEGTSQHVEIVTSVPYKDLKETPHTNLCQSSLSQWITSNYLSPRTKYKIQQQIENTSEISLEDFFLNKLYDDILADLMKSDVSWEWQGPAHVQHYEVLNLENAGDNVKELHRLFSSEHFVKLLSEFTDLRLTSYHSLQIQRWTAGNYTVIPPASHALVTELDVILYLGAPDKKISGGSTVYLAPEEAESIPLITIEPLNNSLNIVYSDAGTTRFTKYINKLGYNKDDYFYIVTCSYRE